MRRRWVWVALGGIAIGIAITLVGLSREMEHLRWPGAIMMMFLGPLAEWAFGLAGPPSLGQKIILNTVFFVANSAFWGVPAMIPLYVIARLART